MRRLGYAAVLMPLLLASCEVMGLQCTLGACTLSVVSWTLGLYLCEGGLIVTQKVVFL